MGPKWWPSQSAVDSQRAHARVAEKKIVVQPDMCVHQDVQTQRHTHTQRHTRAHTQGAWELVHMHLSYINAYVLYICTCMYIYIYICHILIYTCLHTHKNICSMRASCTHTCIYIHTYMHIHMCVHMYIHLHTYIHACIHTYIHGICRSFEVVVCCLSK